ncbi:MAG: type III pantothenate kinase [Rhodocyclaceae bacterium]|jgi:type III pantothenate kinase|nr:type III pantothenate kinase [Rhodocyclaceae bacterium]
MSGGVLCIDCGNTRLKWGLRDGGRWLVQDALPLADVDRLADMLPGRPARIVACNVAGAAVGASVETLVGCDGVPLSWVSAQASQGGVTNRYDNPAQLGADRWAALVGARGLHRRACLVVNAGTATTIDVLDGAGDFLGGLILPGLQMMRAALAGNTAGLPLAAGVFRDLPRNTDDAIASGCLDATLGAIERMFRHVAGAPGALCLLSGGAATGIAAQIALPVRRVDNLVLEGLARIAEVAGAEAPCDHRI